MAQSDDARPSGRGEQTRSAILQVALRLFAERGYDSTTMRAIAAEAGVSVGNAYYYFASKDHLIQGFYRQINDAHVVAAREAMAGVTDLADRMAIAMHAWLDVAEPYHRFAGQFFRNAADPESPLSPFSAESAPSRAVSVGLYAEVLAGSKIKLDAEMARILPEMLWLHQMGVVLYWVYDRSADRRRCRSLVDRTAPMAARAVTLSRYKVLRPLVRQAVDLVDDFLIPDPG